MSDLTWEEYVEQAVQTAPDQSAEMQLLQGVVGLNGETWELRDAPSLEDRDEEIGDLYWYLALAVDALEEMSGDTLDEPMDAGASPVERATPGDYADRIAEIAEGYVWQEERRLDGVLFELFRRLSCRLNVAADADPHDIWAANIEKLRSRHGSSFTPAGEQDR